jgi:hypothetical protein
MARSGDVPSRHYNLRLTAAVLGGIHQASLLEERRVAQPPSADIPLRLAAARG